jgi:riboflavin kinase/FMN adenylyltransferase
MKIYNSVQELNNDQGNNKFGLTIGSFDGVHRGHQELIKNFVTKCKEQGIKPVLISFNPHPREILLGRKEFLILPETHKLEILSELGIVCFVILKFTRDFSTTSPESFFKDYLLASDKIQYVHVGHDFSFGANRKGDFESLNNFVHASEREIVTFQESVFKNNEGIVSSTKIRKLLQSGEIEAVNANLGRSYSINAIIEKGNRLGRELGFPTANMSLSDRFILPQKGVYISKVNYKSMVFHSITNIGTRPTFGDENKVNLETHILDFDKEIYGETLKVEFLKKIRDEQKFTSANDLIRQIELDLKKVIDFFK